MLRLCLCLVFCGAVLFPSIAQAADGDCNFDKDFCQWTNDRNDNFDWDRRKGSTPSHRTGPSGDPTGDGHYIFIESSSPRRRNDKAALSSAPQGGVQCMRFFYNMYGNAMGSLFVIITHGNLKTVLWSKKGNQGPAWHTSNVTVYGKSYVVSFVASVGRGYTGDAALDRVSFVPGSCNGESVAGGVDSSGATNGSCSFDLGACGWENDQLSDSLDWQLSKYPSRVTPKMDHGGKVGGRYYYFDGERSKRGRNAVLISRPMCGTHCLQLFHFMSGYNVGELNLYKTLTDHSEEPDRIVAVSGNQGRNWNEHMVELNAESSQCYRLTIEGVSSGYGSQGRIAVDDLLITDGSCCSLATKGSSSAEKVKCNFDKDFCNWQNSQLSDFSWTWGNGKTRSAGTGPDTDSSGIGGYAYIEASEPRYRGEKAVLVSSNSLSGTWCMRFKYHMYGADVGSLTVYRNNEVIWSRNGNHGNQWLQGYVDIDCSHMFYQMSIEAAVGTGWRGDIAIDEIEFTTEKCPAVNDTKRTAPEQSLVETQGESCNFETSFCHWFNSADDEFDWIRYSGETPSTDTGPSYDHDGSGKYIYMEASGKKPTQTAKLNSKVLSGHTCLKFYYLMYGKFVAELKVEFWDLDTDRRRVVWSKVGEQGSDWILGSVEVNGTNYKVSFVGVRGLSWQGDIALDVISSTPGNCSKINTQVLDAAYKVDKGDCSFDSRDFCEWENVKDDDKFDWMLHRGRTPSSGTGPRKDHGTGKGYYAFIETSQPRRFGDTARLSLQALPISICLEFYYHMYGRSVNALRVYRSFRDKSAFPNTSRNLEMLWELKGPQGNEWKKAEVDIPGHLRSHRVLIEAEAGNSYTGDIGIDDIVFSKGSCKSKRRRH